MATTQWFPNAAAVSQVEQATVTAFAVGGVLKAAINSKTVSYTCVTGDTAATAATAWLALLQASTTPTEFQELTWAAGTIAGTITATAKVAGTPFAGMTGGLVFSATSGAGVTQSTVTANSSPSDAANPLNWLRGSLYTLPQPNDDLVVADTDVPILWNIDTAFPNVALSSFTRYQSFTGTIGLNENNPAGYKEFRATYLKLKGGGNSGSSSSASPGPAAGTGVLNVVLGFGAGSGPTRERYDFQNQQVNLAVIASGQPLDAYAIRILGTNAANAITTLTATTVGVAMLPGEAANLASAQVGSGGLLALGPGCTFTGALTATAGLVDLNCVPGSILLQQNSQLAQGTLASNLVLNYGTITLKDQSSAVWLSGSNIANLVLQTGSTFSKGTQATMTLTSCSIEVNSCTLSDPFGAISFTNRVQLVNALQSGPFRFPAGKFFAITT